MQQGLLEGEPDVDHRLPYAAAAQAAVGHVAQLCVEQHDAAFLHVEVLHFAQEVAIDVLGGVEAVVQFHLFAHAAAAQFAGSQQRNGLGAAHAAISAQVINVHATQRVEASATVGEHALHELHGVLLGVARAYEYGKQFGLAQVRRSEPHELFTRAVVGLQVSNAQFHLDERRWRSRGLRGPRCYL